MSEPVAIPSAASRAHTPVGQQDLLTRPRSDTICTTSSSTSDPESSLQTPQTPSILHVLGDNERFADSSDPLVIHRKTSYGFGQTANLIAETESSGSSSRPVIAEQQSDFLAHPDGMRFEHAILPDIYHQAVDPITSPVRVEGFSTKTTGTIAAVRRKLQRSKSSLKALTLHSGSVTPVASETESTDGDATDERHKKHRLRRILRSLSFSGSSSSLRAQHPTIESGVGELSPSQVQPTISADHEAINRSIPDIDPLNAGPISRDYVTSPSQASEQGRPLGGAAYEDASSHLEAHDQIPTVGWPERHKGKGRMSSTVQYRPRMLSAMSAGSTMTPLPVRQPISPILTRPRSMSMPHNVPAVHQPKIDLFGTRLPRELQLKVLKSLMSSYQGCVSGRWEDEDLGRRELIRLSRVSKSWQSLCFDGHLWTMCDLNAFAPRLHPNTLSSIISAAGLCIRSLSLKGFDNLYGPTLINSITRSTLSSLQDIDLRGCHNLTDHDLCRLIVASPNLTKLNLRGVQATSTAVIRCLARHTRHLSSLDISRCWDVTLCDLAVWLKFMTDEQAAALQVLRVGGIRGYSPTAQDFLPLVASRFTNLRVLDLQACTTLSDADFEAFATSLDARGGSCRLTHLNLSNCTSLSGEVFQHLTNRAPGLTHLELASLPLIFGDVEPRHAALPLINMLRTMPLLQRIDMEGTGISGCINDRVLDALTPPRSHRGEILGRDLTELRLGYAAGVTPEGLIRLVRGCGSLGVLELDNTTANNAVMREFIRRRDSPHSSLSLVDCRAVVTPAAYSSLATSTRPRAGFTGWAASVFAYEESEMLDSGKTVLKTFWSWKRVVIPAGWRDVRASAERGVQTNSSSSERLSGSESRPSALRRRRGSWWRDEDLGDDRSGCVIM
ncbi:hypothetical protein BD324DRAFT_302513 [Kockovaella imperatae]|uniref:F-box domain-containing protein n=1 Tax=Kockovaella imperatae TaxID=4999 RepID=A0A1Y1UNB8_9TREE|nr:hypothetical protein BD324DRAFT_302513 [Kockovaella imperatae]ORX38984.1 hypothetical protein BD324DRAFT_302513 [Kockovaella imperatae]